MRTFTKTCPRLRNVAISLHASALTASAVALWTMPVAAMAQDANVEEADGPAPIVVTAQRRTELSRDVPITISAADETALERANVDSLIELPKLAPGVRIDQQGSYTQPTIRGIGTTLVQTAVGSSVGTYVDGFYLPSPLALNFPFSNVKSVQVLKGPQGTLFGRNTTGGAILITTAQPSGETGGMAEASYERFNALKLQGYLTTGLTENIAFNIEAQYGKGDGFVRNLYDGSLTGGAGFAPGANVRKPGAYEKWSIRTGLKIDLSDTASLLLRYEHLDNNDPTGNVGNVHTAGGVTFTRADATPGALIVTGRRQYAANSRALFRYKSDAFQLTGSFDLGGAELTSYTQYRRERIANISDNDRTPAPLTSLSLPEKDEVVSQELLVNSKPGGRLQYTAGIFLFRHKIDAGVDLAAGSNTFFPFSATGAKVGTYAAYVDGTYELADDLFLTAGVRYSHDEVKDPYYQTTANVPGTLTFQSNRSDDRVTPRIVLRYKPGPASSIYASFTKGHKAAVPDYRSSSGGEYLKPEDINAFELGYKYASGSTSVELAGFYYDYKNLQNGYYLIGATVLSNAAKARIKGIEGSVRQELFDGFEVSAAATYIDAKYRDYPTAGYFEPVFIADNDGDGRPEFNGFNTSLPRDASGNQMQRIPKFSGNIAASYTTTVAGGELVGSANLYHTSRIYFDAGSQFSQGSYDLLSARIQWTDPSDTYTVAIFGDNLLDEAHIQQMVISPTGAVAGWGKPATYGASIKVSF